MKIRVYPPFSEEIGRNWVDIPLKGTLTAKELISLLCRRFPSFERYCGSDTQDPFYHFLLLRGDAILGLEDAVSDEDTISITLPLAGG